MARPRRPVRTVLIIAAVAIVILLLGIGIVLLRLGPIIRKAVETAGRETMGVETRLGEVTVDLTEGRVTLNDFHVANPKGFQDGTFLKARRIDVTADLGALMADEIHLEEVVVDNIEILYDSAGPRTNAGDLMSHLGDGREKAGPDGTAKGRNPVAKGPQRAGGSTTLKIDVVRLRDVDALVILENRRFRITLPRMTIRNIADEKGNGIPVDEVAEWVLAELLKPVEQMVAAKRSLERIGSTSGGGPTQVEGRDEGEVK